MLRALENAFGLAESGDDLYFTFRMQQQQPGEKLSAFLRRLERCLSKVIQRSGLSPTAMDGVRLEQLLRGTVNADLMLIQLRLRERRSNPPTFLELLKEICTEEECAASRAKLNYSLCTVHTKIQDESKHSEIQSLRAEIKEVKSMFTALSTQDKVAQNEKQQTDLEKKLQRLMWIQK